MNLKPCPCCGGSAHLTSAENHGFIEMEIWCDKCGDSIGSTTLPQYKQEMESMLTKAWEMHEHSFRLMTLVSGILEKEKEIKN